MKMYNIISSSLFIYVMFFTGSINAEVLFSYEGDTISYNENTNTYTIRYEGDNNQINEVNWIPPNDVTFTIDAEYKTDKTGKIKYKYEVEVSEASRLPVSSFSLNVETLIEPVIESPDGWKSFTSQSYNKTDLGLWVNWITLSPIEAGKEVEDFSVSTQALPVYDKAYSAGAAGILAFVDYGPNVMVSDYWDREVESPRVKGKGIYTAVPMIPISVPFNPVETYTSFHKFLLGYIDKGFIDQSIAISLTGTSTAVLTALTANDINGALSNLKVVNKLIEGEHKNEKGNGEGENDKPQPLILKELREILKFNLKFINKKLNS